MLNFVLGKKRARCRQRPVTCWLATLNPHYFLPLHPIYTHLPFDSFSLVLCTLAYANTQLPSQTQISYITDRWRIARRTDWTCGLVASTGLERRLDLARLVGI